MNKGLLIRLLLTLAVAAVLYGFVDWTALARAVAQVDGSLYLLSTMVFLASFGLFAWRLKVLLAPTDFRHLGWRRLLHISMSSLFYGFAVPSDFGTAIARWYQLTRNRQGRTLIALITLFERILMLATTALFALAALCLSDAEEVSEIRGLLLAVFALIFVAMVVAIAVMFSRPLYHLVGKPVAFLQSRIRSGQLHDWLAAYWRIHEFQAVKAAIPKACVVQLLYQAALVLRFVLLFHAIALDLPIADITWISMTVLLLTTIPITIAGLGVREGGFAALLAYFLIAPEFGVLVGLLAFSQFVLAIIWGGVIALVMKNDPDEAPAASE